MDIFFPLSSLAGVKKGLKECKVQKGWKTWPPFQPCSPQLRGGGQWIHESTDSEVKDSWVQTPVLPLSGSETSGMGIKIISGLQGGCESSVRCCVAGQACRPPLRRWAGVGAQALGQDYVSYGGGCCFASVFWYCGSTHTHSAVSRTYPEHGPPSASAVSWPGQAPKTGPGESL